MPNTAQPCTHDPTLARAGQNSIVVAENMVGPASSLGAMEPAPLPQDGAGLIGRRAECDALDQLLDCVRAGESRALVVHGEPGVGKTALLDYIGGRAAGCRVIRASGVESEMEIAHAALQQLCASMLNHLDHLPKPQRDALSTAVGLSAGSTP